MATTLSSSARLRSSTASLVIEAVTITPLPMSTFTCCSGRALVNLDHTTDELVSRADFLHCLHHSTWLWIEKPCASKDGAASGETRNSRNLRASGLAETVNATGYKILG